MTIIQSTLKENSLAQLKETSIVDKIVDFLHTNPFPIDSQYHKLAEDIGIDPDELEQYAYAMLTVILCGGDSKGKEIKASKENLDIGSKIEVEHVSYDTSDKVVKHIQEIFANKIKFDHLSKTENYYVDGVNFKEELKREQ